MIQKLTPLILKHRYEAALFGLMALASAICVMLVAARIEYSDSRRHLGLVWNLFLAWIPFVLAYLAYAFTRTKRTLYLLLSVTAVLWLLFFPNAPYLLTDLQDLVKQQGGAPLWYDVILLVWFSWTGLLLGLVSLYLMHDIVQRIFGRWQGWGFVFFVSVLSSFGVYLGRFVRFNSWDVFSDPKEVAITILGLVIDPSKRVVAFTALFAVFYLFVYLTMYSFAHLVTQQRREQISLQEKT